MYYTLCSNKSGMAELLQVMREVPYAALKRSETAPDPKDAGCQLDEARYVRSCRRLRNLGLTRWDPHGPRVLDPDSPGDLDLIHALFSSA